MSAKIFFAKSVSKFWTIKCIAGPEHITIPPSTMSSTPIHAWISSQWVERLFPEHHKECSRSTQSPVAIGLFYFKNSCKVSEEKQIQSRSHTIWVTHGCGIPHTPNTTRRFLTEVSGRPGSPRLCTEVSGLAHPGCAQLNPDEQSPCEAQSFLVSCDLTLTQPVHVFRPC